MSKTIRVSDDYHGWVKAHNREDETMEETLRRLTRGPDPGNGAGLLTAAAATTAKDAVDDLRSREAGRVAGAREAFESE